MTLGPLAVVCSGCGQVWPQGSDSCPQCGEPLSTVGRVLDRHKQAGRPPRWLQQARSKAPRLKAFESAQSDQRMQIFQETERRRVEDLRRAEAERRRRDRHLILGSLSAALLFLLVLAAFLLLSSLQP